MKMNWKKAIIIILTMLVVGGIIVIGERYYAEYKAKKEAERIQMLYSELKKLSDMSVDLKLTKDQKLELLESVSGAAATPTE